MRLTNTELRAIEAASREVLPPGTRVALFGSRTDDDRPALLNARRQAIELVRT